MLDLDKNPLKRKNKSFNDARNIILTKENLSITGEEDFILKYEHDLTFIGKIPTDKGIVYFSTNNTISEIGFLPYDGVYTVLIRDTQDLLNFNLNNPIQGIYKLNFNKETIICWWDGILSTSNRPCILNIDNLPFQVDGNYDLVDINDIELLRLFPHAKVPTIEVQEIIEGAGTIEVGVHYFTIAYEIDNFDRTNYFLHSNPIYIADLDSMVTGDVIGLGKSFKRDTLTSSKSIILDISNLDTKFKTFRLAVVTKINGVLSAKQIGRFEINGNTQSVTYNGVFESTLNINDLTIFNASYEKIETGIEIKNQLAIGNIVSKPKFDYQKYANNIETRWFREKITTVDPVISEYFHFNSAKQIFKYKTYTPDEVYAFYITWIYKDGTFTDAYHIPGRVAEGNETELVEDAPNDIVFDGIEQTVYPNRAKVFHLRDTSNNINGKLSYWENETEVYPNVDDYDIYDVDINGNPIDTFTTLKGEKVRHHKMPSLLKLLENNERADYIIGMRFNNIKIPKELLGQVQGYFISYANRDSINRTVIGYTPIIGRGYGATDYQSNGGGYHALPFDALSKKPSIHAKYIKALYIVDTGDTFIPATANEFFITDAGVQIEGNGTQCPITVLGLTTDLNGIDTRYIPEDNSVIDPPNTKGSQYLYLGGGNNNLASGNVNTPFISRTMGSIHSFVPDIFKSFYNQSLISTGKIHYTTDNIYSYTTFTNGILYGGDTILNVNRMIRFGDFAVATSYDVYTFYSYNSLNFLFKNNPLELNTDYNGTYLETNTDWASVNNIKVSVPFNPYLPNVTEHPFRIARSINFSSEDLIIGWRTFVFNDFFEQIRNKGKIVKLSSMNRDLLIQHEFALFKASIKDKLVTQDLNIYLGNSDLFDREPDEIVDTEDGYIGCESKFANFTCELGYVVIDSLQGKIFTYDGKITEISKDGMFDFFKRNTFGFQQLTNNPTIHPYTNGGFIGTYDKINERILITKVNKLSQSNQDEFPAYTLSYYPAYKGWACFHDYIPNDYSNFKGNIYCVNNTNENSIYLITSNRNTINKKIGKFFEGITYSSYVDILFNDNPDKAKRWTSFEFQTEVKTYPNNVNDQALLKKEVVFRDKPVNKVMIYNNNQCSGEIDIIYDKDNKFISNIVPAKESWYFNKFIDVVKDKSLPFFDVKNNLITSNINNSKNWFDKSKFFSKFIVIRLLFNNIDQNRWFIHDVKANGELSNR